MMIQYCLLTWFELWREVIQEKSSWELFKSKWGLSFSFFTSEILTKTFNLKKYFFQLLKLKVAVGNKCEPNQGFFSLYIVSNSSLFPIGEIMPNSSNQEKAKQSKPKPKGILNSEYVAAWVYNRIGQGGYWTLSYLVDIRFKGRS